jgi:hypothetical protein
MYSDYQTEISKDCLKTIISKISQPPCLLGGWAVFLFLNDKFQTSKGREYLGSRDIDLGFHLNPDWSSEEYNMSELRQTIASITSMGFESVSFRFVKHFSENGNELTREQARKFPKYEMFDLYIDLMVDTDDKRRVKLVGFPIAEELLLKEVFENQRYTKLNFLSTEVLVPDSSLLTEMKMTSFLARPEGDKRSKDLTDICALLLYLRPKLSNLDENRMNRFRKTLEKFPEEDWESVASILDEKSNELKRFLNSYPMQF